ncbi:TPA: hypothetical protein ACKRXW_001831 [Proteus mirabilis]|jgi:hypothetical protein|uniref:SDH family Clp fold serine proteinase n=1 Tax=Morganellaceae TaxID=1903414 RepID=UPI0009AD02B1|nr:MULTISPECIES: hypothetical protein [Proteus]ARA23675.1 hypothetical protein AM438_14740 [Proteus mirabilis]AWF40325.1 serine dehydrogenase ase family protein [Proteus mirabilis]EIT1739846.1 hypothetical protein [Proteus mirabilis]EKU6440924.1 hypothetical protein [Proteus mirabilis]EKU7556841.1 hypothetical protein [Proteus mirabilis]
MSDNQSMFDVFQNLSLPYKDTHDLLYYNGPINWNGYEKITSLCRQSNPEKDAILILLTYGGDPNAAYRIARAIRHNYKKLTIIIPSDCKSAGTLITIGATNLIIGDCGELGPLDVQLRKQDEMFENSSALDYYQALSGLQHFAKSAFKDYLLDMKSNFGVTAKMAAEFSSNLTTGLFSKIYAQLDPIKLGEVQRAVQIAESYGERLNEYDHILQDNAMNELVAGYPSHSFVIDRKEASKLFKNVSPPLDEAQADIVSFVNQQFKTRSRSCLVLNLSIIREMTEQRKKEAAQSEQQPVEEIKEERDDSEKPKKSRVNSKSKSE